MKQSFKVIEKAINKTFIVGLDGTDEKRTLILFYFRQAINECGIKKNVHSFTTNDWHAVSKMVQILFLNDLPSKGNRHEIYKYAKESLLTKPIIKGLCSLLHKSAEELNLKPKKWSNLFHTVLFMPEFASLDTGIRFIYRDGDVSHFWFHPNLIKPRIEILDRCIEMTKP